jgi:putative CocE/NonD family hydrolase
VRIPVFHQTGWLDGTSLGTRISYQRMVACGHPHQKLVIGPWDHAGRIGKVAGADPGVADGMDLQRATLAWFDQWLKDIDTGILREPPVSVFVLGSNRWLTGDTFSPDTRETWFLPAGASAARRGELVRSRGRWERHPVGIRTIRLTHRSGVVAGEVATPMTVTAQARGDESQTSGCPVYVSKRLTALHHCRTDADGPVGGILGTGWTGTST